MSNLAQRAIYENQLEIYSMKIANFHQNLSLTWGGIFSSNDE